MVQAYILIQTEVGKAASVAEGVRQIPGVIAAEDVTGPYDVVVRVQERRRGKGCASLESRLGERGAEQRVRQVIHSTMVRAMRRTTTEDGG